MSHPALRVHANTTLARARPARQRDTARSPFVRIARDCGFPTAKAARERLPALVERIEQAVQVLVQEGHVDRAMLIVSAVSRPVLANVPAFAVAELLHDRADAGEDLEQGAFRNNRCRETALPFAKKLGAELFHGEIYLAAIHRDYLS